MVATLSLPVSAQPLQVPPVDQVVQQANPAVPRISVDKTTNLANAIKQAEQMMAKGDIKEVMIDIKACDSQKLPLAINAKGKITIVGCGDKQAGIDHDEVVNRTVLTPFSSFNPTEIKSPVEFRGIEVKNARSNVFKVLSGITIANSVFHGSEDPFGAKLLVDADLASADSANEIVIKDSRITGLRPILIQGHSAKVAFQFNKVVTALGTNQNAIEIAQSKTYKNDGSLPILVENNDFEVKAPIGGISVVKISRGDVKVHDNRITLKDSSPNASGIILFSPQSGSGMPIKNVGITYNIFSGSHAITNSSGIPIEPKMVTINDNDFSETIGVLPKSGQGQDNANASVTKGNAINAQRNVWGKLDRLKTEADTSSPKDKYTRPEVPMPQPPEPPKPPMPEPKPDAPGPQQPPAPPAPPARPQPVPPAPAPAPQQPQPQQPSPQVPTPTPSPSVSPAAPRSAVRVAGETRFETAVKVAQEAFKSEAKAVVLARGDVAADSVSAVPFAQEIGAPVLLTPSDALHPAVEAEIKRLLPKGGRVYLMGGEAALAKPVADAVAKLGGTVERVAGPNRAATAVAVAERLQQLQKANRVLVADGTDWQADLIAGPAAAAVDGVTLLTNGDQVAPETAAFLAKFPSLKVSAIGANAVKAMPSATKINGANPTALSVAVAQEFFSRPTVSGVATTDDFADALSGGVQVAMENGPLLLVSQSGTTVATTYLDDVKTVTKVYAYGGTQRITEAQLAALTK